MAKLNTKRTPVRTHAGGVAKRITPEMELRRSVMSCLLWEKEAYEDGDLIATRIANLVSHVHPKVVSSIAIEARNKMNLRHVPLLIITAMVKLPSHRYMVSETIKAVVSRPDELSELLAMYFIGGKKPLAKQLKTGLAKAFTKFNAYQLAKWNRPAAIRLRDVMFLCHPKPKDSEQAKTFKQLARDTLPTPDTWEVALSTGGDKNKEWTRLLNENKLGALALLRNLRNMNYAGVDRGLIKDALTKVNTSRVLPFRYIAAARYAPYLEDALEASMFKSLSEHKQLKGKTVLLLDVSGSMNNLLSDKSDLSRLEAACGLAMLLREICEDIEIFTFSLKLKQIAPRRGFALRDAIVNSQDHNATYLGTSVRALYAPKNKKISIKSRFHGTISFSGRGLNPDRLIILSDEQSHDSVPDPKGVGYMINVASARRGVGYGPWRHVDGFSESVVKWIQEFEDNNY